MQIVIFGAPGAGKGTQAKVLSTRFNIPHISTGDILRESIRKETEIGLAAKEIIEKGELVSDNIMCALVKETLQNLDYMKGFILDGFPRTVNQAHLLMDIFRKLNITNPYFLILEAEDDIIISRLTSRRACSNCRAIVNLHDIEDENICPKCGSENTLVKRKDDDEEVIKIRLRVYREQTKPVLDYSSDKFKIILVNGTDPVDLVTKNIIKELEVDN